MSRFEVVLEIGQCLHERPRCLARCDINRMPRMEMANEAGEHALNGAHRLERKMDRIVSEAMHEAAYFVAQERGEVYVRENERQALRVAVQAGAQRREETHAVLGLIPGEQEEPAEEHERNEDENEVRHGV
ncbi:MAG: hypothetical protein B7X03_01695 [Parcubacteria group bacterium 21-58-10]|nr:MAG: hypothetical protein B7X03_01695 [Parcubacteria group bacterium 21-58-10]